VAAPAISVTASQGSQIAALSTVTINVLACRVSMATNGVTTMVTELPT
jgi:hypothetical protein